jgi:hypothetical protein
MAIKKKPAKKSSKAKKSVARKPAAAKKKAATKKPAAKKVVVKKKAAAKKPAAKKTAAKKIVEPRAQGLDTVDIERTRLRAKSGVQSGDLQGLSRKVSAASESVDELLEEGNAFEAGILQGVEDADEADEDEVLSHEVLADDVPEEYLDED